MAVEALGVLLGPDARPVTRDPGPGACRRRIALARLSPCSDAPTGVDGWLRDLVEDPASAWRSAWLRACAIHAARGRGLLARIDLAAAHALGDPIVEEELACTGSARAKVRCENATSIRPAGELRLRSRCDGCGARRRAPVGTADLLEEPGSASRLGASVAVVGAALVVVVVGSSSCR